MRTALTRWTPVGADRFSHMFEEAFNEMLRPYGGDAEGVSARAWTPAVDVREDAEGLTLLVDLPGLTKDDVAITVENNLLTIAGERKHASEQAQKNETFHRLERQYGAFSRSFTLAPTVHTDKVEATFRDGVLSIHLPKQEASKPRRISIG